MARVIIRLKRTLEKTGLSRSSVYELISKNKFPKQVKLGGARSIGFVESEVDEWIDDRIAERDGKAA